MLKANRFLAAIALMSLMPVAVHGASSAPVAASSNAQQQALSFANDLDMSDIEDLLGETELAIFDAEDLLGGLLDGDGLFNFDLFDTILGSGSIFDGLSKQLGKVLNQVLVKVQESGKVFDEARGQIKASMKELDKTNPDHAQALANLKAMLKQINKAENRYKKVLKQMASKLDVVVDGVDMLMDSVDQLCPIPFICSNIADRVLQPIKNEITQFQKKLKKLKL